MFLEVGTVEQPPYDAFRFSEIEEFAQFVESSFLFFVIVVVVVHGEVDGNDGGGSHFACHIDGQVVGQSAVVEHIAVEAHRLEQGGNGHAGSHVPSEGIARKHHVGKGAEVGGEAGEFGRSEERGARAADKAVEHGFDGVSAHGLACEKLRPLLRTEKGIEVVGAVADAIKSADNGADARSNDDVGLNPSLFHHFQHTDVGGSLRTATAEDEGQGPTPALPRGGGGNFLGDYKQY